MIPLNLILKKTRLQKYWQQLLRVMPGKISSTNILLILAVITGVLAGYSAVAFRMLIHFFHYIFYDIVYAWLSQWSPWLLFILPVLGSIVLIPAVYFFKDNKGGYGIPVFLTNIHLKGGVMRTRQIFLKLFCPAITIGSGGSAGVEGPAAQIGGTIGSVIGRFFEMSTARVKALISCGAAAGLAAQFNAPITGILFVQEVIMMGKIEMDVFSAVVIASGIATAISRAHGTGEPLFGSFAYGEFESVDLLLYALMGLVMGILAFAFIRMFLFFQDFFAHKIKLPMIAKMLLGSLSVGLLGLIHPGIMGEGYDIISQGLADPAKITLPILGLLVVLKMVATSITLGSGNFGGVFGPSLFIGTLLGGFFTLAVQAVFPDLEANNSMALVGMGAFLAATTHAPLTSIFLLFEITGNYEVIIPVMISSVIGMLVCKHFSEESIDTADLVRKGIKLHKGQEVSILSSIKVSDIMITDFETVDENMHFSQFIHQIQLGKQQYYPVMNNADEFLGVVSLQDVREFILEEGLEDLVLVSEIMTTRLITLTPGETMEAAMDKFSYKDIDVLPVVDPGLPNKLVGMLKRRDMIAAYNKELLVKKFA